MVKDLVREAAAAGYARISAPRITEDDLYRQIDDDFIAAPPVTLHGHVPELLAAVWAGLRESALAELVSIAAWASARAVRRIASWL
jgi:hypothetical protein